MGGGAGGGRWLNSTQDGVENEMSLGGVEESKSTSSWVNLSYLSMMAGFTFTSLLFSTFRKFYKNSPYFNYNTILKSF